MKNISDKFVEKIKQLFPKKKVCLLDNVEKYGTARQVTDDNIIRRMCFACWIPKASDTHLEYVIFIAVTATVVAISVTLHVHFLSYYLFVHS